MKKKKQLKSENKTRIKVATSHADMTPAQLKKYGVCEHNQINYKTLVNSHFFIFEKGRDSTIKTLSPSLAVFSAS